MERASKEDGRHCLHPHLAMEGNKMNKGMPRLTFSLHISLNSMLRCKQLSSNRDGNVPRSSSTKKIWNVAH